MAEWVPSLACALKYIWLEVTVAASISGLPEIQIKNISEWNIHADQANPPWIDSCHFKTHKTKSKRKHCQHAYRSATVCSDADAGLIEWLTQTICCSLQILTPQQQQSVHVWDVFNLCIRGALYFWFRFSFLSLDLKKRCNMQEFYVLLALPCLSAGVSYSLSMSTQWLLQQFDKMFIWLPV